MVNHKVYRCGVPGGAVTIQAAVFYGAPILYVGVDSAPSSIGLTTYQARSDSYLLGL
jgi:hypothetical protein